MKTRFYFSCACLCSGDQVKEDEMRRACSMHGEMINGRNILAGKPEAKIPVRRTRHVWEDNIGTDLTEIFCEDMDWIKPVQKRDQWRAVVNTVMNLWVP
jgi:hypothetical protein